MTREDLHDRFELIRRHGERRSPYGMFGIECGLGWCKLLWNMLQELEEVVDENFYFTQIKEKYGSLRVYYIGGSDEVDRIIAKYEDLSYKTCERCGSPGEANDDGWVRTLCKDCRKVLKEEE